MASRSDEASPSFALPADSSGNPLLPPDANEDFHFDGHISNDVELLRQVKEKTERRRRKWGGGNGKTTYYTHTRNASQEIKSTTTAAAARAWPKRERLGHEEESETF